MRRSKQCVMAGIQRSQKPITGIGGILESARKVGFLRRIGNSDRQQSAQANASENQRRSPGRHRAGSASLEGFLSREHQSRFGGFTTSIPAMR
jgi:hypothetical protein